MPLNYSKWDNLELSDDSDIEEHPNIDKKSMIRWKQQDIHRKRAERQQRITNLKTEIALNDVLRPRITQVLTDLESLPARDAVAQFASLTQQLTVSPSPDKPPTNAPNQPTYDMMLLHLLEQVAKEAREKQSSSGDIPGEEATRKRLAERLAFHRTELDDRTEECKQTIKREEEEANRKITSEGIHEGFDSGHVNQAGPNYLTEPAKKPEKTKTATKETSIEVLNAPKAESSSTAVATSSAAADADDEDDELPKASQDALAFLSVAYLDFDRALAFIQAHPAVLAESTTDELFLEGFNAELEGNSDRARRCVEKGQLVSYCRKLGRDGVRLFFQRMNQSGDAGKKARKVFVDDVDQTYARLADRVRNMDADTRSHMTAGEEAIQLVAEGDAKITFNLPDGPPPATIVLEGEGTEGMDPEEVRKYLVRQWEILEGFPENLREALKTEDLDKVNGVLGRMKIDEAEAVVGLMHEANILSFSDNGEIRDETGKGKPAA